MCCVWRLCWARQARLATQGRGAEARSREPPAGRPAAPPRHAGPAHHSVQDQGCHAAPWRAAGGAAAHPPWLGDVAGACSLRAPPAACPQAVAASPGRDTRNASRQPRRTAGQRSQRAAALQPACTCVYAAGQPPRAAASSPAWRQLRPAEAAQLKLTVMARRGHDAPSGCRRRRLQALRRALARTLPPAACVALLGCCGCACRLALQLHDD